MVLQNTPKTPSSKQVHCEIKCVQLNIPGGLLGQRTTYVFLLFTSQSSCKRVVTEIIFQSLKILCSIINCCAAFWHLRSVQINRSVTQTGPPVLYFIVFPEATQHIPLHCLTHGCFWLNGICNVLLETPLIESTTSVTFLSQFFTSHFCHFVYVGSDITIAKCVMPVLFVQITVFWKGLHTLVP